MKKSRKSVDRYSMALEKKHKFYSRKPCIWCGHKATMMRFNPLPTFGPDMVLWTVMCLSVHCSASGPVKETQRKAELAWGRRPR